MINPAIELRDVRHTGAEGVDPVALSLTLSRGTCAVLLGPSRCGSATVLRLCAGLLIPDHGTVRVLGRDPADADEHTRPETRLDIGTVLQPPGLLSNMTVFNNVALPLRYHRAPDEREVERVVMGLLDSLELGTLRDRFPATLRFGEAKLVALARALIMEPELVLIEEPDAGLDAESMARCRRVIGTIRERQPLAVLATLSHPSPWLTVADRIVYMRNGRVVAEGPHAALLQSADPDARVYLGA
jgi:ABC-type transporter Mla maintaining outer membrane lipid asymmetry ATPase subunit MlaF